MTNAPVELIQARIANPGWTPGRKDMRDLLTAWRSLEDAERDDMQKRLARLDAPSVKRAMELFAGLDERSRGELTRPIMKSYFKVVRELGVEDQSAFPMRYFQDQSPRVRKSVAQAVGSSWDDMAHELKNSLVRQISERLPEASDDSERKAMVEALGKSGDAGALRALTDLRQAAPGVASNITLRAKLTLQRDVQRGDSSGDFCRPECLDGHGTVLWFTPGVEQVARSREPLLGAAILDSGVLKSERVKWLQLAKDPLWRTAGVIVASVPGLSEAENAPNLAAALAARADEIIKATSLNQPGLVRVRLGRDDGRTRNFVWEFAEALSGFQCGLINDGRDAHWELRVVSTYLVLVPLKITDERFIWRDETADGASDPTIASALVEMARLKSGDVVYDPFCGSATELILAGQNATGLRLFGSDINEKSISAARMAISRSGVGIRVELGDALLFDSCSFSAGPFDAVITNPPFGMRTVRGGARDLLQDFLLNIRKRLSRSGRVVLMSHAPVSSIHWAEAGGLVLTRSAPVQLGAMRCELQRFEIRNESFRR
ncbi:MAG: N-6 DNA methylase [Pseudomonadota bacterium]